MNIKSANAENNIVSVAHLPAMRQVCIFILRGMDMETLAAIAQLLFTVVVGVYFFTHLKGETGNQRNLRNEYASEAERLNRLRRIHLSEPVSETARPVSCAEIVGQEDGMRALRAALWGKNPQHVIIYGPPGVGKTAAARVIMNEVKNSPGTPFAKNAPFIETDATIMRCDEHGFADPLIGSVHDPIYQGSGAFGESGLPQPKAGAVTRAHGGILFLDEIGELPCEQLNKLLKVLEDRRVILESSYYSSVNRKNPPYIRDVFENGLPADFRLIGATTEPPEKIPEAVRSRCTEIFFNPLSRKDLIKIVNDAALRAMLVLEAGVSETVADYSHSGRDAVKLLQFSSNLARMDSRAVVTVADVKWAAEAGRYKKRCENSLKDNEKIIDISFVKPFGGG